MRKSDRRLWVWAGMIWWGVVCLAFVQITRLHGPESPRTVMAAPESALPQLPDPAVITAPLETLRTFLQPPPPKPAPPPRPAPVVYRKVVRNGVPMHVVQMDTRSSELRIAVATARGGIGRADDWSAMIDRTRPTAALTGTYFCTDSLVPIGSIVVDGFPVHQGTVGTAFAFSPQSGARVMTCLPGRRYSWNEQETVLRAGPRLLTEGKTTLWPAAEGFKDPNVYRKKQRTAVAITRHKKLLLVAVEKPVLLRDLAGALKALGAVDAMCLDGGGSTGLYYRGKTRVKPDRKLTNLLLVYDTERRARDYAAAQNPGARIMLTEAGKTGG